MPTWGPGEDAGGGFVQAISVRGDSVPSFERYPFSIPAVREMGTLRLHPGVTFFVGENGSGKSTLIEALAAAAGFNAEGGTKNYNFATQRTDSELGRALQLVRGVRRETDGFFLRAESLYNVATELEAIEASASRPFRFYGGKSLHAQSHGESFMALAANRFAGDGLYILDEPESALSPARQLALLKLIDLHVRKMGSQYVIATHSAILMAYPQATIYHLSADGIAPIDYEDTEHYRITRDFLNRRESFLHHLFVDEE